MKSRPGAGYGGPGVWGPKNEKSSTKSVRYFPWWHFALSELYYMASWESAASHVVSIKFEYMGMVLKSFPKQRIRWRVLNNALKEQVSAERGPKSVARDCSPPDSGKCSALRDPKPVARDCSHPDCSPPNSGKRTARSKIGSARM